MRRDTGTGVAAIVILFFICPIVTGQVTFEEAQRRLEQRKTHATSQPAGVAHTATQPAAPAKQFYAKADAPEAIRLWLEQQPQLRSLQIEAERTKLANIKAEGDSEVATIKAQMDSLRAANLPTSSNGKRIGRSEWVDPSAEAAWKSEMENARHAMGASVRNRDARMAEQKKVIADMEADTTPHLYNSPKLTQNVGSCGTLGDFAVDQIIDGNNMLIRKGDLTYWLSDFNTDGSVDDQKLTRDIQVIVAKTRRYETHGGSSRTVFEMQPIDVARYVEVR